MSPHQPFSYSISHFGRRFVCFLGLSLCLLAGSMAAPVAWDGGGADNNWGTPLNWGGTGPLADDSLFFGGSTRLTSANNLTADTSFSGITFNSGAGAFTLSGNRITLAGSLTNNSSNTQVLSLPLLLNSTQSFDAASGSLTLSGVISGVGGLTKLGVQTLTLNGSTANTYSGLTSVSAGTLRLDKTAGVDAIAGNLEITAGGKVTFGKNNQLADTTIVTVTGAGSVFNGTAANGGQLSGISETIAGLTVTGGVFNAGANANWTITGAGSFAGGADNTIFVGNSGARLSFGSLSLSSMTAVAGGNVATNNSFTLYGNSTTLSSITVGSGGLSLDGSRLNLRHGGGSNLGSKLVVNGDVTTTGTTGSFITEDTAGGTSGMVRLELSSSTDPVDRVFNIGAGGADLTVNVEITDGASTQAGITKTGNGTLTFSGAYENTYTGTTSINAGTLILSQSAGVNAVSGNIHINSGGTLTLSANEQIADTAGITVETGGSITALNRNETFAFYTQNGGGLSASGNTGQITITGALTLAGGNQFTINSLTSATPAHFQVGSAVLTGANLLMGGNNGTGNPRTALTIGSGGLSMTGRTITMYRGTSGAVINLNGDFTGNGTNLITVAISGDVDPEFNLGTGDHQFDVQSGITTMDVGIVGIGGLTKVGDGTLLFSGSLANTYTGTTTISGGILNLNQTAGVDAIAGLIDVRTGGTLTLSADEQMADTASITVNGGLISPITRTETIASYTQNTGGLNNSGNVGNLIVNGTVTLAGGSTMTINSSASATPPSWDFGGAVLTGANILIGGSNGASNPKTRLTIRSGGLTLAGRSITMNLGDAGVEFYLLGDVTASGTSAITTGTGSGVAPELHLGTGTRTFQINSGTTTVGLSVMDAAAIDKTGNGTLVMTSANTYSGGTTVSAGTLWITNTSGSATGTGSLLVSLGATLRGTGNVVPSANQNITVNGSLTIGGTSPVSGEMLTLNASGVGTIQLNGAVNLELFSGQGSGGSTLAVAGDRLVVAGQAGLTLGAGAVLNVTTSIPIDAGNTAGWVPGTSWQIIDWSGLSGGQNGSFSNLTGSNPDNFVNLPDLSPLGYFWDVSSLYTTGIIVVVIPEPSRGLLVLLGLCGFLMRRQRR